MKLNEKFMDLTADLVSERASEPFLQMLLALPAGQWLSLRSTCADLPSASLLIAAFEKRYKTSLYAVWLMQPEAENNNDDYGVVIFYADALLLSSVAIYNKARLQETQVTASHLG